MSQVSTNSVLPASADYKHNGTNPLEDLGTTEFLNLLVAELQNQDPLEPTDNSQLLQQISQIREISANDQLKGTLEAVQQGQDVSTASQLIGKTVRALSDDNEEVEGVVSRATVEVDPTTEARELKVHVGDKTFGLDRIREIVSSETT